MATAEQITFTDFLKTVQNRGNLSNISVLSTLSKRPCLLEMWREGV